MDILPILLSLALAATVATASTSTNLAIRESSALRQTQEVQPISFYGLNYNTRKGPDWAADRERCKSRSEVVRDLEMLSRITTRIRLLSLVDCNQGALVWSVLNDELAGVDMEVWLGLWVGPDPQVFTDEYAALVAMIPDITNTFDWQSRLSGISVGSEAIYREDVTISEAIVNLNIVRSRLNRYGMSNVPVAIVDIAPIYSNSQELRLASDTIMTNTFPFWEGLPIDLAIPELEIDLGWLLGLPESQGKNFVLSEHGWPSGGYLDDVGIASPENQKQYLEESFCYLKQKGWAYYWFTAIDNDWRQLQDPDNTIEGNWGFLTANLGLKDHFVDFEFSCDDGSTYSFAAVDWSVPGLSEEEPIDAANASCGLWQGCEALAGKCCPTPSGDYLGCCRSENFLGDSGEDTGTGQDTAPPTPTPTNNPSPGPTPSPTNLPTGTPTKAPTSASPTNLPTPGPTTIPPTNLPTALPTFAPTNPPTRNPTVAPTVLPTETIITETTGGGEEDTSSAGGSTIFPPELIEEEIFPWDKNGGALPSAEEDSSNSDASSGTSHSFLGWRRTIVGVLISSGTGAMTIWSSALL